jgi:hypothetical protein
MLAGLARNAAIDGVSRAGVDGDGGWVRHRRAVDARWVGVASRVGVGERWERNFWQVGVLLSVPLSGAWDRLDDWEALARHLVTGGAEWRVRWGWWVNQAETWFALLNRAHGNAVPCLADSDFFGDATVGVVARNTVLLANPLQEAIDNLKGDPLPLAVALQLHDFLNRAVVSAGSLGKVVVVSGQDLVDLQGVGASLLLKLSLTLVAHGRLIVQCGVLVHAVMLPVFFNCSIDNCFLRHVLLHPWHGRHAEGVEGAVGAGRAEVT